MWVLMLVWVINVYVLIVYALIVSIIHCILKRMQPKQLAPPASA